MNYADLPLPPPHTVLQAWRNLRYAKKSVVLRKMSFAFPFGCVVQHWVYPNDCEQPFPIDLKTGLEIPYLFKAPMLLNG